MDEYRLSPKAREDLEAIWLYSLSEWGENQTEQYIDILIEVFVLLTQHPKIGVTCNDIRQGYLRYPTKRHMVYYRKTEYGIEIMRLLHNHMLTTQHIVVD